MTWGVGYFDGFDGFCTCAARAGHVVDSGVVCVGLCAWTISTRALCALCSQDHHAFSSLFNKALHSVFIIVLHPFLIIGSLLFGSTRIVTLSILSGWLRQPASCLLLLGVLCVFPPNQ